MYGIIKNVSLYSFLVWFPSASFEVYTSDDFNDGVFRGYSQISKIKKESQIIKEIKDGSDYRTDSNTQVQVGIREGVEYIHSIPNGKTDDNIQNLPKY